MIAKKDQDNATAFVIYPIKYPDKYDRPLSEDTVVYASKRSLGQDVGRKGDRM